MGGAQLPKVGGEKGLGSIFGASSAVNPIAWVPTAYNDIARSVNDPGGAKNTASNAATAQSESEIRQSGQAASLQQTLLTQPKNITPDNFLATKSAQLANLRLGLASTITGASGTPGAVLGSTSLSGNGPGKTKLGQ